MKEIGLALIIVSSILLSTILTFCIGEYWNYTVAFLFFFIVWLIAGIILYKIGSKR